jgi:hypothetical protein
LASVYGSYIWPKQDGPQYKAGFGATTGLILAGGAVTLFGEFGLPSYISALRRISDMRCVLSLARYKYGNPPRIEEIMQRNEEEAKKVRMERQTSE